MAGARVVLPYFTAVICALVYFLVMFLVLYILNRADMITLGSWV